MRFRYRARDEKGTMAKGELDASTKNAVVEILRRQKLYPISIDLVRSSMPLSNMMSMFGKVSDREVSVFTRQLATMITAGLPITDALNLLKLQAEPKFSVIVANILDDVQGGVSLSDSLARYPNVFSKVYISLVRAGEAAGVMETILTRLADNLEKGREFKNKLVTAMIYPAIILIGMLIVMIIMVVVVMPKLTELYQDFDAELPLATTLLIGVSGFVVKYWFGLLVLIVGGVFFGVRYVRTSVGRAQFENFIFRVPLIGPMTEQSILTELTSTLGLLVSAGVSVVEALNIVAEGLGNMIMERELKKIARQVERGFPLSISFSESEHFPPLVGQMIAVGEETGKMDDVLAKLSHYFESELDTKVKGLTTAIEPIIIMILALGVGFLMYAVIMPMYTITNSI